MKLSIITINLNNKAGLEKTINSVLKQDSKAFEYLVIDGGSTDGSAELLRAFDLQLSYWVSEPDAGIYSAMNKGARLAKGDYLLFLNSGDCLVSPETLTQALPHLGKHDLVYGQLRYDREEGFTDASYPEVLSFSYLKENYLPHPSTFIRRKLLLDSGLYQEEYKICADWVFFIKAVCKLDCSYVFLKQPISIYNTTGLSAQASWQQTIEKERQQALEENFKLFLSPSPEQRNLEGELHSLQNHWWYKLGRSLGIMGTKCKIKRTKEGRKTR